MKNAIGTITDTYEIASWTERLGAHETDWTSAPLETNMKTDYNVKSVTILTGTRVTFKYHSSFLGHDFALGAHGAALHQSGPHVVQDQLGREVRVGAATVPVGKRGFEDCTFTSVWSSESNDL